MELILLRHGIAQDRAEFQLTGQDDHRRQLTEKGKKRVKSICQHLKNINPQFDIIVSSSLVRALQTREIAEKILPAKKVLQTTELSPVSPPEAFVKWLRMMAKGSESILVIGHEPQLGLLASYLLANQRESFIDLRKSGMICLEIESCEDLRPGTAILKWAASPRLLLKKRPK
ncbi:MAG: phosphohistidine phosphatase SixA [Bdellovibrionia bacterium]